MTAAADDALGKRSEMVEKQLRPRGVASRRVLTAMAKVPRERFLPPELRDLAYADQAVAIGCGQTISQPFIVALMTEALQLSGSERVLEIGAGSGYQTALLAELAARVTSIERHEELYRQARARLDELGYRNVRLIHGDGTQGLAEEAPFERILVAAAADHVPPKLFEQLAEGGLMVIPLGDASSQTLYVVRKARGEAQRQELSPCRFVPFVGAISEPHGDR